MHDGRVLIPLKSLAIRALGFAVSVRLLLMVVSAMLAFVGGDGVDGPLGVVVLTAAVAVADIHRRHERMLWANLGYPLALIAALFAAVAAAVETVWALL